MNFQFEDLTTGAGIAAAAAATMVLIQILKAAAPVIFSKITGAAWITILLAVLYVIAGLVVPAPNSTSAANFYLALFLSWAACVTAALGLYTSANTGIEFVRSDSAPKVIGSNETFKEDTPSGLNTPPGPPIS